MYLSTNDAKSLTAAIDAANEIAKREASGDINAETVIGIISNSMKSVYTDGYKKLPRVVEGGFLRTEDVKELVDAINANYKAFAAEIDLINSTAEMISSIINASAANVHKACGNASTAAWTLAAYHAALNSNSKAVVVIPSHIEGTVSKNNSIITSGIKNSFNSEVSVKKIETNGSYGNLLEAIQGTQIYKSLESSEIAFADLDNPTSVVSYMYDEDPLTLFEVEAYKVDISSRVIPTVNSENIMPNSLFKMVRSGRGYPNTTGYIENPNETVQWYEGPTSGQLYADIILKISRGSSSHIKIEIADKGTSTGNAIPFPRVDRVDVSANGTDWRTASIYNDTVSTNGTSSITIIVNEINVSFAKVRLSQSVPYNAIVMNAAHWAERDDGTSSWLSEDSAPAYNVTKEPRSSWLQPKVTSASAGVQVRRHVFAVPGERFAICIKDIKSYANEYESLSEFRTKEYKFNSPLKAVLIKADESIPSGTSITYEISHDSGTTWTSLVPIERSGQGPEVIIFAEGGYANPNVQASKFVSVDSFPKSIRLRGVLKSTAKVAPAIKYLSIQPVFSE